jgi:ketosteroid isomerase-like protein
LRWGTTQTIGKESGVETELPFTVVVAFRNGRMTHYVDYGDRDQALEAAGLRE